MTVITNGTSLNTYEVRRGSFRDSKLLTLKKTGSVSSLNPPSLPGSLDGTTLNGLNEITPTNPKNNFKRLTIRSKKKTF